MVAFNFHSMEKNIFYGRQWLPATVWLPTFLKISFVCECVCVRVRVRACVCVSVRPSIRPTEKINLEQVESEQMITNLIWGQIIP